MNKCTGFFSYRLLDILFYVNVVPYTKTTTYSPEFCLPFAIPQGKLLSPFGWGKVKMARLELLKVSRVKVAKGDQFHISVNVIPVLTCIHTNTLLISILSHLQIEHYM